MGGLHLLSLGIGFVLGWFVERSGLLRGLFGAGRQ